MNDNSDPVMYSVNPCDGMYYAMRELGTNMFSIFTSIDQCFDTMDTGMKDCAETIDTMMSCFDACS